MVINSHYESCNNFEKVVNFAKKHRTCDVKTCLSTSERATAISNILQTNEFNFSILYCCFFSYSAISSLFHPIERLRISLEILTKQNIPRPKNSF